MKISKYLILLSLSVVLLYLYRSSLLIKIDFTLCISGPHSGSGRGWINLKVTVCKPFSTKLKFVSTVCDSSFG